MCVCDADAIPCERESKAACACASSAVARLLLHQVIVLSSRSLPLRERRSRAAASPADAAAPIPSLPSLLFLSRSLSLSLYGRLICFRSLFALSPCDLLSCTRHSGIPSPHPHHLISVDGGGYGTWVPYSTRQVALSQPHSPLAVATSLGVISSSPDLIPPSSSLPPHPSLLIPTSPSGPHLFLPTSPSLPQP